MQTPNSWSSQVIPTGLTGHAELDDLDKGADTRLGKLLKKVF